MILERAHFWLTIGLAASCAMVHANGCERTAAGTVKSESRDALRNPIATSDPDTSADGLRDLDSCLGVALDIPNQLPDHAFVGGVTFDNKCDTGLAILTAPFEVRVGLNRDQPFMNETTSTAVYGILYVYPFEMSREDLFWPLDGGFRTLGHPEYICIPRSSQVTVVARAQRGPLTTLPIGQYKAFLRTVIAPSDCQDDSKEIDLELSVERFNRLHPTESHFYQRPEAGLDFSHEVTFRVVEDLQAP